MVKKKAKQISPHNVNAAPEYAAKPMVGQIPGAGGLRGPVETTGRFVVIFKSNGSTQPARVKTALSNLAGLKNVVSTSDYDDGAVASADMASASAVHYEKLGVVVVKGDDAVQALAANASAGDSPILAIEPEYLAYPSQDTGLVTYLRGYRDAVNHLWDQLAASGTGAASAQAEGVATSFQDTDQFTWGLQAIGVPPTRFTGKGIKVAILDTGFDLTHPDFLTRVITSQTFSGAPVQDVFGHGTHCVGTACGPQKPASGVRRYGVASEAQIFVGKVFNNTAPRPSAATGNVIAGIEWAMTNGCQVVSLSLGITINQKVMQYETPLRRALQAGTLVVAAAGNNADRPTDPGFVEPPANADAAIAVAAVDRHLQIARFSARSSQLTGVGGIVNIAGPGVAVFSSLPGRHGLLDGTSMATPHVAGVAALWAQASGDTGEALWNRILSSARPLTLASVDVGSGLAQAPR
jgi:subtilisin family serine protease